MAGDEATPASTPKRLTPATAVPLLLLLAAAFLGNYFSRPLFFGADFVFGSIAVLVICYLYGPVIGLLSAVFAHSYTYILWRHPYAMLVFTLEALVVALLVKNRRHNLLLADGLFWFLLGMPLSLFFHKVLLDFGMTTAVFIMLKQGINGIFNALLANFIISCLPLNRFFPDCAPHGKIKFQEVMFGLLATSVLIPALLLIRFHTIEEKQSMESTALLQLQKCSSDVEAILGSWYESRYSAVYALAQIAGRTFPSPSADLQKSTEDIRASFSDLVSMHVENPAGRTIAFSPVEDDNGESTVGRDFSYKPWFKAAKATHAPLVSDVFIGNTTALFPLVIVSVPVEVDGRWVGCACAGLDLSSLHDRLIALRPDTEMQLTLIDAQSNVIASTKPSVNPGQTWIVQEGTIEQVDQSVRIWQPAGKNLATMEKWRRSWYQQEVRISSDLPWKLVVELPIAQMQKALYQDYVRDLGIAALLVALTLLLSHYLSKRITKPVADLAAFASDLPIRLADIDDNHWPQSRQYEIELLNTSFKVMTKAMQRNFRALQDQSDELISANQGLQKEVESRIRAEEALWESEKKYRLLAEHISDVIWILDFDAGRFRYITPSIERLRGYTPMEVLSQDLSAAFTPGSEEYLRRVLPGRLDEFRAGVERTYQDEIEQPRKDGSAVWTETTTRFVINEDTGSVEVYGSSRDITERKRAEEEKENLEAQLSQAQKLETVGRLAGGVAHDFNNMLTVISANTDMAQMELDPDQPAFEYLSEIRSAANRSANLTRQLLGFARKQTIRPRVLDLNETVSGMLNMLKSLVGEDIELVWMPGRDVWNVRIDPSQVDQVLANLAVNARDAIPQHGSLTMATENVTLRETRWPDQPDFIPGDYVSLRVSDTGCGMTKEVISHIFEPFFTTKPLGRGTGLGLATVFGIVRQNKGFVSVDSESGRGTTFTIFLPRLKV